MTEHNHDLGPGTSVGWPVTVDSGGNPGTNVAGEGTGREVESPVTPAKQRRGFAAMDPARQKEIASKGGKASHEKGTGHEWDREAARTAGRKGGIATKAVRTRARAGEGSGE